MKRNEAFTAIQNYISGKSSVSAKTLKADAVKDSQSLVLNEEISHETTPRSFQFSVYPAVDEKRYYKLTVHNSHKELITESYLRHVLNNCLQKLYSNNPSQHWNGYNQTKWSHAVFEHPATFDTLAMDAKKKEEIMNDLIKFRTGRDYFARIGKAWKRGYLLYSPPGTGKSTMIAAMANLLEYDVYDLELTAVKDKTELRSLLIDTSNKSIIVIENIDCSLVLTGPRKNKKKKSKKEKDDEEMDPITKKVKEDETTDSKVTLSGVLDGLWSSCGSKESLFSPLIIWRSLNQLL
ncbi:hypothetical protein CRYUN_Cryun24cG0104500 [Craigia yunnanensis]